MQWFSVDAADNVEGRYDPNGHANNYRKQVMTID